MNLEPRNLEMLLEEHRNHFSLPFQMQFIELTDQALSSCKFQQVMTQPPVLTSLFALWPPKSSLIWTLHMVC